MSLKPRTDFLTADEYLEREECSPVRHEYVDGKVYAMTGGTIRHNLIAGNVYSLLRQHTRGGSCRVFISDIKVRVDSINCFYYPDVMVACGAVDAKSVFTANPALIVEVLSPSTSKIDRREKLIAYKQINTLKEYIIVHQRKRNIEVHSRTTDGGWKVHSYTGGESLTLSFGSTEPLVVSVDEIYQDVDQEDQPNSDPRVCESDDSYLEEDW